MFHLSHRTSLSFFEHTRSMFTVRKSIAVEEPEPTVRSARPRDLCHKSYNLCHAHYSLGSKQDLMLSEEALNPIPA